MWYNFIVKKKLIVTTAFMVALLSTNATAIYAEESPASTVYPENFQTELTFENGLNDYAVNEDKFAFASENYIFVYQNGVLSKPDHELSHTVLKIAFDGENIVFKDSADELYNYAEGEVTKREEDFVFTESDYVDVGSYHYYLQDKLLYVLDKEQHAVQPLGEYTLLKANEETVYAVKENVLYKVEGTEAQKLTFNYANFSSALEINVGDTADNLSKTANVEFIKISGEAFITETDLSDLSSEYFTVGETKLANDGTIALKLCQTGNATVAAFGGKAYILLTALTSSVNYTPLTADLTTGYLSIDAGVYSVPYMSESTRVAVLETGSEVTIINTVSSDVLSHDYYLVEYGENGERGYIATGFVTQHLFPGGGEYNEIKDENESYENDFVNIIIVLIILLLIFAVIAYLLHLGSSGSKRKNREKNSERN